MPAEKFEPCAECDYTHVQRIPLQTKTEHGWWGYTGEYKTGPTCAVNGCCARAGSEPRNAEDTPT